MKKLISLLVVAVLVVSCMSTAAFAAAAPVVTVSEEAIDNDELTLSFIVSNNPGFKGYGLTVEYDKDVMTLKELNTLTLMVMQPQKATLTMPLQALMLLSRLWKTSICPARR